MRTNTGSKHYIRQSFLSTPDHLTFRAVLSGQIAGIPATKTLARDPEGDLEIIVISQRVSFDEMLAMDGHPDIRVGTVKGANCIAYNQGQSSIMIVADRAYTDLAAVAAQLVVRKLLD